MSRRWMAVVVLVLGAVALGAPAGAHDFTGHEEQEETLACPLPREAVPANQEPPDDTECRDQDIPDEEETYRGMVWDNDVECAEGEEAATPVGNIYAIGDPAALEGGIGLCNEGSGAVPVEGRVRLEGSQESQGFTVTADGDRDNEPEQAQGFAQVYAGLAGPSVRCGDPNGKQDASHIGAEDTQEDCG